MKIANPHPWVKTAEEAVKIQNELRSRLILTDQLGDVNTVAGVDVGFEDHYKISKAAVAVLSFPTLELVEHQIARCPTTFPYIPGFLSFREIPAILAALAQVQTVPDLIICDGQGIAHPRRLGIASHLGIILDMPTIGAAKSRLIGTHAEVGIEKGNFQPLYDKGEQIGVILRTRTKVKPLYISPGHRISILTARDYVLRCTPKYRLPETTRWADKLASSKSTN
jgi:deoxyribonuclease V